MAAKKRGLGRNLDALLGLDSGPGDSGESSASAELKDLPIELIQPGRYQPRSGMDPDRLQELAASIRSQGVVQPVVVRPIGDGRYELIAGERRWRAAQIAELREIPAVIREVPDQATIAMALIENIQREDLNPLEEATALQRLIDEFDLTHQQAADAVGRSRAAVSNLLRLQELDPEVRRLIDQRKLEMGHGRALLSLDTRQQVGLAREAAAQGWSVREVERRVRQLQTAPAPRETPRPDPNINQLETELSERLCTPVQLRHGRSGKGKLVISYHSLDELDGILGRIK